MLSLTLVFKLNTIHKFYFSRRNLLVNKNSNLNIFDYLSYNLKK